jgi:hypothetical protein
VTSTVLAGGPTLLVWWKTWCVQSAKDDEMLCVKLWLLFEAVSTRISEDNAARGAFELLMLLE